MFEMVQEIKSISERHDLSRGGASEEGDERKVAGGHFGDLQSVRQETPDSSSGVPHLRLFLQVLGCPDDPPDTANDTRLHEGRPTFYYTHYCLYIHPNVINFHDITLLKI